MEPVASEPPNCRFFGLPFSRRYLRRMACAANRAAARAAPGAAAVVDGECVEVEPTKDADGGCVALRAGWRRPVARNVAQVRRTFL
jgi:hypothetical protein